MRKDDLDRDDCNPQEVSFSSFSLSIDTLNKKVALATLFSTFGCMNFGYALGWTAASLANIINDPEMPDLNQTEQNLISSVLAIGAILGTFIGADLSDRCGRRGALMATTIPCIAGWMSLSLARSVFILVLGRVFLGISIGMVNTASPAFVAEITPAKFRGVTGGTFQNGVNLGIFICFLISPYLPWRVMGGVGMIFGILMGLGLIFMEETPVWLLSNNKMDKYQKSAAFYSSCNMNYVNYSQPPVEEMGTLARWKMLIKRPQMYKPLFLCFTMALAFQFSAVTIISFYNISMFKNAGVTDAHASLGSQCLGAFQLLLGIGGSVVSAKVPRKPHFLITSYLTTAGLVLIAICYLIKDDYLDSQLMDVGVIVAFVFTISVFAFGAGTITWAYVGELLPADGTGLVVGVASSSNWAASFFLTFYYSQFKGFLDDFGVFFLLAGCHFVLTTLLVWLPETKGLSLAEIQSSFHSKRKSRRNRKRDESLYLFDDQEEREQESSNDLFSIGTS